MASMQVHLYSLTAPSRNQCSVRRSNSLTIKASTNDAIQGRKLRAAVISGGPGGGVETFLFEQSPATAKPCGGAIPFCMLNEFGIPDTLIDRRITEAKIISPSNLTVNFCKTLNPGEFVAMVRRELFDSYLRSRAESSGASLITGLITDLEIPDASGNTTYVVHYMANKSRQTLAVDVVVGAKGANYRVTKSIKAGDYAWAIAFQERIKLAEEKMEYYENLAELYIGNDVSPRFLRLGVPEV